MTLDIAGINHVVQDNVIGVDSAGRDVGVCGVGIKTGGTNNKFLANTIVGSKVAFPADEEMPGGAILVIDGSPTFNQLTLEQNIVRDGPGLVIEFDQTIPEALREFPVPAITGVTVDAMTGIATISGSVGQCLVCRINVYLDDLDEVEEALAFLGSVDVAPNTTGDTFSIQVAEPLPESFGLRTNATVLLPVIIQGFGTGTSTKLSPLFTP